MSRFEALRAACCAANRRLPELGLVDLTFGNVSVADHQAGVFAIKPSGVDYRALTPADIVIVALDEAPVVRVVEGTLRPSSDTPTHLCLLRRFAGVGSVVHTHSRHATAWAQAGVDIPCLGTTHADYFNGPIPVTRLMTEAEVAGDYEWETGRVICERFGAINPLDVPAVLVNGHGPFAWGSSADKALETALALEIIAEMAFKTVQLRPDGVVDLPAHLHHKHFSRKHGSSAYYGQTNR